MTRYFQCEVMDHEIAEIISDNLPYWIGLALDERPKSALACKEMLTLFHAMDGLERDQFLSQIQPKIETVSLTRPSRDHA